MKNLKKISFILLFLVLGLTCYAQLPQKMSYQSVVRNASNQLLQNTSVGVRISILQGSVSGSSVYTETHTLSTNANGLLSLEIGGGSVVSGVFNSINWGNGPYFVKSEIDPTGGVNYTISGTSQLLSVPYAQLAENVVNPKFSVSASDDSAIFSQQIDRNVWVEDPDISVLVPETGKYLLNFSGGAINVNSYGIAASNYDLDCFVRVYSNGIGELARAFALQSYVDGTAFKYLPMNPDKAVIVNLTQGSMLKLQYRQNAVGSLSTFWYIGNDNVFIKPNISIVKIGN